MSRQAGELPILEETRDTGHQSGLATVRGTISGAREGSHPWWGKEDSYMGLTGEQGNLKGKVSQMVGGS